MGTSLGLFNFSLKKTLSTSDDPIIKAQITLFYFLSIINFLKIGVAICSVIFDGTSVGLAGILVLLLISIVLFKVLLTYPSKLELLIHIALGVACLRLWFGMLDSKHLSLIVLQQVFIVIMLAFYGLKGKAGYFYSVLATFPVFYFILINQQPQFFMLLPNLSVFASVLIIVLNFLIIIISHHYYYGIIYQTLNSREETNEDLVKASESKTLFFSTMSHELRTPLNSVIGMANLLLDESKDSEQKENLDILKFSAESLLSLINDILDYNKMESGHVELEQIEFDVVKLVQNACASMRIKASEKDLYCITSISEKLDGITFIGDPTRLLQILYNLISNAIKFTKKGGVEIQVSLRDQTDENATLRFCIIDTGLGISADQQEMIFKPFIQASAKINRKFGGTGLGLSIVKQLLTLHDSHILLDSEPDQGSKFFFDITYKIKSKDLKAALEGEILKIIYPVSDLKILLAEDNLMNILFMRKLFSKWDIVIDVAENGIEAMALIAEKDYDLVLMDIHMPFMNGYEATLKIRELKNPAKSSVTIIALTASVSSDVHEKILEVGMNDSISKPFNPENLYTKLTELKGRLVSAKRVIDN
jgi:signal transduction histidine kinase/CheY-like chemotaxis protein